MALIITESDKRVVALQKIQRERPEQFAFALNVWDFLRNHNKLIVVQAEEKAGKRDITKAVALTDFKTAMKPHPDMCGVYEIPKETDRSKHVYVVGLKRIDIKKQLKELNELHIHAKSISGVAEAQAEVDHCLQQGYPQVVFHIDECDYAAGKRQSLAPFVEAVRNNSNVLAIFYSATPEELLNSDFMKIHNPKHMVFTPHSNYRGARFFLDNGLVRSPKKFFKEDLELSEQGLECRSILHQNIYDGSDRNIGVVRLSMGDSYNKVKEWVQEEKNRLYEDNDNNNNGPTELFYKKHLYRPTFVDQETSFDWGCWEHHEFHEKYAHIIFINQTCTRSTEITNDGHSRLAFWHDERKLTTKTGITCYNTLSQALGRIKHYHSKGHPIIVYGDELVFRLNCGMVSWDKFKGKVSQRVKSSVQKGRDRCLPEGVHTEFRKFPTSNELSLFMGNQYRIHKLFDESGKIMTALCGKAQVQSLKDVEFVMNKHLNSTNLFAVKKGEILKPKQKKFKSVVGYDENNKPWFCCKYIENTTNQDVILIPLESTTNHKTTKLSIYSS